MKLTKKQKQAIYSAVQLEFCKALAITRQSVTDAMNAVPCPLGSQKHFDATVYAIEQALKGSVK